MEQTEKITKKDEKSVKNIYCFFFQNKYQSMTHVSHPFFKGFKKIVFGSVAFVTKSYELV